MVFQNPEIIRDETPYNVRKPKKIEHSHPSMHKTIKNVKNMGEKKYSHKEHINMNIKICNLKILSIFT